SVLAVLAVDFGQDGGYGGIQVLGDVLLLGHELVERLGERAVLHRRDAQFCGQALYSKRPLSNAFHGDAWRAGDSRVIVESDCVVRRVRDDDVRAQYGVVEPWASGHLSRQLTAPAAKFRTPFLLLV